MLSNQFDITPNQNSIVMKKFSFTSLCVVVICLTANSQWIQIGENIEGEALNDRSGISVSLSSDGNTIAIGAVANADNGFSSGHVRIYRNIDDAWSQIGDDIDGEAEGDMSGFPVSMNSDGNRVAIASQHHAGINGAFSGQVRVYEEVDGAWNQVGNDIEGESSGDESGTGVSLSDDGTILAVGAELNDQNGNASGRVRIYQESEGEWSQLGGNIDGAFALAVLGTSVSLSGNGQIIAIGARGNNQNGSIQIFEFNGENWTQIGSNILAASIVDLTGVSVSLSSDGTIVALGSPQFSPIGPPVLPNAGLVRIFQNIDNDWVQVGSGIDGLTSGDHAGWAGSVSLSSDGGTVAVGSKDQGVNPQNAGAVRIFQNISGDWVQQGDIITGVATGDHLGTSVSLNGDGTHIAIGAPFSDNGHVEVYQLIPTGLTEVPLGNTSVHPNPTTGNILIDLHENLQSVTMHVYNTQGVKLHSKFLVSLSSLNYSLPESSGLYFIQLVTDGGETKTLKVVKE